MRIIFFTSEQSSAPFEDQDLYLECRQRSTSDKPQRYEADKIPSALLYVRGSIVRILKKLLQVYVLCPYPVIKTYSESPTFLTIVLDVLSLESMTGSLENTISNVIAEWLNPNGGYHLIVVGAQESSYGMRVKTNLHLEDLLCIYHACVCVYVYIYDICIVYLFC